MLKLFWWRPIFQDKKVNRKLVVEAGMSICIVWQRLAAHLDGVSLRACSRSPVRVPWWRGDEIQKEHWQEFLGFLNLKLVNRLMLCHRWLWWSFEWHPTKLKNPELSSHKMGQQQWYYCTENLYRSIRGWECISSNSFEEKRTSQVVWSPKCT